MCGVGRLVGLYEHRGVPGIALPLKRVNRRVLIKTFPPNGIVVKIESNVGEDGVLFSGLESIEVRLLVGTGRNAEEAVLGVDGVQTTIRTDAHPSDIITNRPNLIALLTQVCGRNEHCQVGLTASRRECGCDILHLALRVLKAEDEHMLCHPALFPTLVGSDTECEALLTEQNITAISRVDRDDGVILRELADITLLGIHVARCVEAAHPVIRVAKRLEHACANAGHNRHIKNNVDRVGDLNADLCERRADRTHRERNHVHRSAGVGAARNVVELCIHLSRIAPVVGRACVFLFLRADEGSVLNASNVVRAGSMQVAAREFLLVQLDHLARADGDRAELFKLLLRSVNPNNLVRVNQGFHFVDPSKYRLVVGHVCSPLF